MKKIGLSFLIFAFMLCLPVLLINCGGSDGSSSNNMDGDPIEPNDLVGIWSGTVTINTATGGSRTGTFILEIIDGTMLDYTASFANEPLNVRAFGLSWNVVSITLNTVQTPSNDCHLYDQWYVFEVIGDTMTLTDYEGTLCEGDGQGGHTALHTITSASGTLTRQ